MSKNRTAARVDSNQGDIVKKLIEAGFTVETGHDDILVGLSSLFTFWFEIKTKGTLKKDGTFKAGEVKPDQVRLSNEWKGHYHIVTDAIECIESIQYYLTDVLHMCASGEIERIYSNLEKIKNVWKGKNERD